jgi:putative endonuclease
MTQPGSKQYRISLGKWAESCAREYLESKGLSFLSKNVRSPHGEIDLIMKDGDSIVFVEVRTRASTEHGYPEEAITENKKTHLDNRINWFLENESEIGDNWRVDIVTIIGRPGMKNPPKIDWWQNEL